MSKSTKPPVVSFRVGALLLLAAALWGWFDVRHRARLSDTDPTVHKTDITVYTEAGAAMFDGRDPYLVSNPRGWHYLYPPLLAIAMAPLALLPTTEQALVWYALSCLMLVGCVVELRRLWQWQAELRQATDANSTSKSIPTWLAWTVTAGMALPTLNCLQRGQVGICIVYFLLLGARLVLCSATKRGILLGGLVLALPVTIKLTPLLPAAVLAGGLLVQDLVRWGRAWRSKSQKPSLHKLPLSPALTKVLTNAILRRKHDAAEPDAEALASNVFPRGVISCVGGIAGLVLWFLLVPAVTIGHTANAAHLRTWLNRVVANDDVGAANDFNFKSKRNQSLDNGVRRLGNFLAFTWAGGPDDQLVDQPNLPQVPMPMESAAANRGIKLAVLGFLLCLAALVLRTAWENSLTLWPAVFGLGCLATVVVSPLSWGHHYVMGAPAMLFVPGLIAAKQLRAAKILASSAAFLLIIHYIALEQAGRIGLLGIGMSLWGAAVMAVTFVQTRHQISMGHVPTLEIKAHQRHAA